MKKTIFLLAAGLLAFGWSARAAEVLAPSKDSGNVLVGASEVLEDLYTAGNNININGDIQGDLTAAGGVMNLGGRIEQSLLAAAGTLNIGGEVGETVRAIAGTATISSPVGGDLVVAGGNVIVTNAAAVAGDVLVFAGSLVIDAPVEGSVRVVGGSVTINGEVGGDVRAQTSQSLTFGPAAAVAGTVYHKGVARAVIPSEARIGQVEFTQMERRAGRGDWRAVATTGFLLNFLAVFLATWLLARLRKPWLKETATGVFQRPWSSLGWGFVILLISPLAIIAALLTLAGYYVALVAGAAYLLMLLLSRLLAAWVVGTWLAARLFKTDQDSRDWIPSLLGSAAGSLLGLVPVLGWAILAVIYLQALGSGAQVAPRSFRENS